MKRETNRKILVIDDSPAIHEDFRKILVRESKATAADAAKAAFLGAAAAEPAPQSGESFEMHSAHQGTEGLEMVRAAREAGEPFAMAFVDVRMPPGWDGVQTIEHLWQTDPELEVVMCTAYSDYSWNETIDKLGSSDRLLILKKPFDPVEISQLACALTAKWSMRQREQQLISDLTRKEQEARAYASSLETVNRALESNQAVAERSYQIKNEFLVGLSGALHANVEGIIERALSASATQQESSLASVEALMSSSQRLLTSLEELGTLAELDAGQLVLHSIEGSPASVAASVVESLRPLAESKSIGLDLETQPNTPPHAVYDESCLRRVLEQLVRNAIEHTHEGHVTVRLGGESTSDWREERVRIEVQDTGSGIAPEDQATVFEPFVRSGATTVEASSVGTGLGLTLVKRLAQQMRAEVGLRSRVGEGTSITLTLPPTRPQKT